MQRRQKWSCPVHGFYNILWDILRDRTVLSNVQTQNDVKICMFNNMIIRAGKKVNFLESWLKISLQEKKFLSKFIMCSLILRPQIHIYYFFILRPQISLQLQHFPGRKELPKFNISSRCEDYLQHTMQTRKFIVVYSTVEWRQQRWWCRCTDILNTFLFNVTLICPFCSGCD